MKNSIGLVVKINNNIEEEITLEVNGIEVICFANVCPYDIEVGEKYPVMFSSMTFDDYNVKELHEEIKSLKKTDNAYSYVVKGKLEGEMVLSVIDIVDDGLLDYKYLDGSYVEFKIDRLDVEFL